MYLPLVKERPPTVYETVALFLELKAHLLPPTKVKPFSDVSPVRSPAVALLKSTLIVAADVICKPAIAISAEAVIVIFLISLKSLDYC